MRLKTLLATFVSVALLAPVSAQAQQPAQQPVQDVVVDEGVLRPFPIAVVGFTGQNGNQISQVISANLRRSGFFDPLNPASFVETGLTLANAPNFPQWTAIGAQAVLYGSVTARPDGRNDVGFRLYDPYRQCQLVSYQFTATPEQWRRIAHKISDVVYQRMTGEAGFFDSRVLFVSESGTQLNKLSRLTIVDQDGYNPVFLTQGDEIIMSPRFSASNPDEVTYVALGRDYSRIYLYNLSTGRRESLGEFDGQVLAPRFSNDGSKVAFSIIRGGNTDVYVMNLRTRQLSRLTTDPGIDTSPSFSPDGNQIVFTSDRSGSARLYVMRADGSGQRHR
jgi:TolB protein